jgi:hypothetical protein
MSANAVRRVIQGKAVILSHHIPNSSPEQIAARLQEAKKHKPTAYNIHPGLILINDRLLTLDGKLARVAITLFNQLLDALEASRDS